MPVDTIDIYSNYYIYGWHVSINTRKQGGLSGRSKFQEGCGKNIIGEFYGSPAPAIDLRRMQ